MCFAGAQAAVEAFQQEAEHPLGGVLTVIAPCRGLGWPRQPPLAPSCARTPSMLLDISTLPSPLEVAHQTPHDSVTDRAPQAFMLAVSRGDAGASLQAVSDRVLLLTAPLVGLTVAARAAFGDQGQVPRPRPPPRSSLVTSRGAAIHRWCL